MTRWTMRRVRTGRTRSTAWPTRTSQQNGHDSRRSRGARGSARRRRPRPGSRSPNWTVRGGRARRGRRSVREARGTTVASVRSRGGNRTAPAGSTGLVRPRDGPADRSRGTGIGARAHGHRDRGRAVPGSAHHVVAGPGGCRTGTRTVGRGVPRPVGGRAGSRGVGRRAPDRATAGTGAGVAGRSRIEPVGDRRGRGAGAVREAAEPGRALEATTDGPDGPGGGTARLQGGLRDLRTWVAQLVGSGRRRAWTVLGAAAALGLTFAAGTLVGTPGRSRRQPRR